MNLRIERDVRVRLDQSDVAALRESGSLRQVFKLGTIVISVGLSEDVNAEKSRVACDVGSINFILSRQDSLWLRDQLASVPTSDAGLKIEEFMIQVDKWDSTKRKKVLARQMGESN